MGIKSWDNKADKKTIVAYGQDKTNQAKQRTETEKVKGEKIKKEKKKKDRQGQRKTSGGSPTATDSDHSLQRPKTKVTQRLGTQKRRL